MSNAANGIRAKLCFKVVSFIYFTQLESQEKG